MIREGDYVIAKRDTLLRLVQVRKDRPLFLGKRNVAIGSAIGHPYGSFFEMKGNGSLTLKTVEAPLPVELCTSATDLKDNRSLLNSNDSQKLTTNDIEEFKSQNVPGEEIVKFIVENSSSFEDKSSYSQEKYLKKKQLKYVNTLQVLQPNARLLVETFYGYSPQKVCNLRMDMLSQMLTFCNVISSGKFLVVDTVLGLLSASVLERIGNEGLVMHLLMLSSPSNVYRLAVDALNLSPETLEELLISADLQTVLAAMNSTEDQNEVSKDNSCTSEVTTGTTEKKGESRKKLKSILLRKIKSILSNKNMDGLLVASKHHPACTLQLLDYLAFSRPFAIYSMYSEPLVDCYQMLKMRGDIILLTISETWLRKYQVLPERTHPEYGMSSNGGYLLTGIKVEKKGST